jgi:hypothetical protein
MCSFERPKVLHKIILKSMVLLAIADFHMHGEESRKHSGHIYLLLLIYAQTYLYY